MPGFHSTLEVITVGILGMLMVGIWAGISRLHWFIRAVVLLGAIWALIPVRVYEPAFYFLMMLPIVGICVAWIDHLASRAESLPSNAEVRPQSRKTVWLASSLLCLFLVSVSLVLLALISTESKWVNWFILTLVAVVVLAVVTYCIMVIRSGNWLFISFARSRANQDENQMRFRFSIGGIMLGTVVIAMVMGLFATLFPKLKNFDVSLVYTVFIEAVIVTIAASISYCWRMPVRTTNLVFAIAALVLFSYLVLDPPFKELSVDGRGASHWPFFIYQSVLVLGVVAITVLMRTLQSYSVLSNRNRNQTVVCCLIVIVFLALFLPVAPIYRYMLGESELPPQDLPATNNFSRVVKTVEKLAELNPSKETLAEIKSKTKRERIRDLYVEMRKELSKTSFVDFDLDRDRSDYYVETKPYQILNLMKVAEMLDNETKSRIEKGKFEEAAILATQTIQLGNTHQVGGMTADSYLAAIVESKGYENLNAIRHDVSIEWTRRFLKELSQLKHEDPEIIKLRESVWQDHAIGWRSRIVNAAVLILDRIDTRWLAIGPHSEKMFTNAVLRNDATFRLLQTDVAIRLYDSEMGKLPRTLDDLVPCFLEEVPLDPFSGKPLIFRKTKDSYALFCVGFDRVDNGGRFAISDDVEQEGFDFDLDIENRTVSMPFQPFNSIAEARPFVE